MHNNLTFGQVLEAMREGKPVTREGWEDGVYSYYVHEGVHHDLRTLTEKIFLDESKFDRLEAFLVITKNDGSQAIWVPSVDDLFAKDWKILEDQIHVDRIYADD